MAQIYLFDWGDTLMVDFSNYEGPMCQWPHVTTVDGAKETLAKLSERHQIYVATGAGNSTELEIKQAFERAGLAQFIVGYFCRENLGVNKDNPLFYQKIVDALNVEPHQLTMVGDSINKDIIPAQKVGLNVVLLTLESSPPNCSYSTINKLTQLIA